jgi:hypothetical protein
MFLACEWSCYLILQRFIKRSVVLLVFVQICISRIRASPGWALEPENFAVRYGGAVQG